MTEPLEEKIFNALNALKEIGEESRYEKICALSELQRIEYKKYLDELKRLNKIKSAPPINLDALKGKALEDIVTYLFKISGNIFIVDRNLRTSTNEIDQLIKLSPNGKILCANGLISAKFNLFISECKNYNKSIDVTYIGKFCSLLLTNQIKLGLLFSYHGVSGSGWSNGSGLIKKFYLHREEINNRFCIINFDINDFESILNGKNILQIIDERLISLQLDTDYSKYISKHPAET